MEDLDGPRVMPGAAASIVADLTAVGVSWDPFVAAGADDDASVVSGVVWQSRRTAAYEAALQRLIDDDVVYACRCSRKDLAQLASAPHAGEDGPPYPGTCRDLGLPMDGPDVALRVRVDRLVERYGAPVVVDRWCGLVDHDVVRDVGDVVIRRKDGLFSYQLAVVVDDGFQGVTEVVRGRDLLSSAPRQVLLHRALGQAPPSFAHLPLLVDDDGHRLSKRSPDAPALVQTLLQSMSAPALLGHLLWLVGGAGPDEAATIDTWSERLDDLQLGAERIRWQAPRQG